MKALDLFSGYGGITLALEGYIEPIAYCEIEKYAQAVLAYRMAEGALPRAPILADVRNVKGSLGDCDIIVGGFPCQDLSAAGARKGLEGERSGLFFEIIRLAKEIRPTFVFLENVPAIRTNGLSDVLRAFTEIGYDCRWTCISAASVGAPHKRERWFLLAHSDGFTIRNESRRSSGPQRKAAPKLRNSREARLLDDAASEGLERRLESEKTWKAFAKCSRAGFISRPRRIPQPAIRRDDDGFADRVDRLKVLGNGVVPHQVRKAFETLLGVSR